MKRCALYFLVLVSVAVFSGCKQFEYRMIQPGTAVQDITKTGIVVHEDPLDYRWVHRGNHVSLRINNPTATPVPPAGRPQLCGRPAG